MPENIRLSIIIPILNEAEYLDRSLAKIFMQPWVSDHCEVIISDGGSQDASLEIASQYPCRVVHSGAGRALQMNTASQQANGKYLLFLHADSSLPPGFDGNIKAGTQWGYFHVSLSGAAFVYRIIEAAINLRSRISKVAGGDQGLFFNKRYFESLDGYPRIPLMEDIAICKLARRRANPVIIKAAITSSSRRWQDKGILKTILLMWTLRLAYWIGVDPHRLHKIYYPQRG